MSTTSYEQQWQGTRTPSGDRQEQTIADPRSVGPQGGTRWDPALHNTHTHTPKSVYILWTHPDQGGRKTSTALAYFRSHI